MHLQPKDREKLRIVAADPARRRQTRGLKLNYPEAMAILTYELLEGTRDGRTVTLGGDRVVHGFRDLVGGPLDPARPGPFEDDAATAPRPVAASRLGTRSGWRTPSCSPRSRATSPRPVKRSTSAAARSSVTPGWSPEGEYFRFDELRLRTEIRVEDGERTRRLVVDQLRMVPGDGSAMTELGMMEGHSHTGQLLIADRRLDDELYAELAELLEESQTRSGITRGGIADPDSIRCVAVRSLAGSTKAIAVLHRGIVDLLR